MVWVVDNVVELANRFVDVASADPLAAVLVVLGLGLTGLSAAGFGLLALRALLDPLTASPPGRVHGRVSR